jgi:hypothetical protein
VSKASVSPKRVELKGEARLLWRDLFSASLDAIYQDSAARGAFLTPDAAMAALMDDLAALFPSRKGAESEMGTTARTHLQPRMDRIAGLRDAHRYAVNLFYRTYFPRKGAPPIPEDDLAKLLDLHERGLSYGQIAQEFKLPYPQSKDMIRKRIAVAKQKKMTPASSPGTTRANR